MGRQPPGEETKAMVSDMLRQCTEQRKALEDMAMAVIDQDGGEAAFNQITGKLDRLERLQDEFAAWVSSASTRARHTPPASPPLSQASALAVLTNASPGPQA